MVLYGGYDDLPGAAADGAWSLSVGDSLRWDSLATVGAPPGRYGHAAVYDRGHDRMVVFGGFNASTLDETWAVSLADPPTWTELSFPTGPVAPARLYASAIYDPLRQHMLVFGGLSAPNDTLQPAATNDTWILSLGDTERWDLDPPVRRPRARYSHSAIYDPIRDRMIVYGGLPLVLQTDNVWARSLHDTGWSMISVPGSTPEMRYGHSAIYDPVGDRMIVFGGQGVGGRNLNDVWELSLATPTWKRVVAQGGPPTARAFHSAYYDSSHNAMVVFGGAPNGNDNTWVLSLGSVPTWSPGSPELKVSSTNLQLPPTVTVGDTVSVPFSFANTGFDPLYLGAIRMPSDEWRFDVAPPRRLVRGEEAPRTLLLIAREPRFVQDSLVIDSNDPVTPRMRVTLGINVRGLEFQTHVLGTPAEVPLGVSFIVVATPATDVRVEGGTLLFRKAGSSSPFDSLALTPLATDFIAAVPAGFVTESGVEYYVRIQNSDFSATSSVFTQPVAAATSLTAVPRPTSGSDFLVGRDIEVEVLLPPGAVFVSGHINYRQGGEQAYETDTVTAGVLGRPVALIPARVVGPRGVEYWIEVQTLRSALRFPANAPEPSVIRTRVQSLAESAEHAGGRYRLLSVPLDFGEDFSGSLDAILSDQLGTYDPVQWRAYRYDPDSLGNLEFSSARAARFRPEPGRAFWLISKDPHRVNTAPIDGFSTATALPYPVVLQPGWNQIGNPFDFGVAWAEVARDTTAVGAPVAFDPARGTIGDYSDVVPSVLAPFEGYFVENVATGPETLWVTPREAILVTGDAAPTSASGEAGPQGHGAPDRAIVRTTPAHGPTHAASNQWSFRLEARSAVAADRSNVFGVQPEASDDFDPLDLRKPPRPPGPWVGLAFAHPEWNALRGRYRRDLRAPDSEGHTWEVELLSGTAGEAVTLELSAMTPLPPGLTWRVLDRELGSLSDLMRWDGPLASSRARLRENSDTTPAPATMQYPLVSFGPRHPYRLAIIVGSEDYVRRAADLARTVPVGLMLDHGAPNPFRAATRIRFGLPRAAQVSMEVYSVLGERVATLMDRTRLEPGYHAVIWDGTRSNGGPAPSGIYLVRLVSGGEARSGRLVLVR